MAHGSTLVAAGSGATSSPKTYTLTANQTSGYKAVLASVKDGNQTISGITDSKSGTWSQRHNRNNSPRTEIWVRTAGTELVIGDTITVSHSFTINQVVIVAEFNPASFNEDSENDNIGTSSSPSCGITTLNNTVTVVAGIGVTVPFAETIVFIEDAAYTHVNDYHHLTASLFLSMGFKDYTSNGAKTYAPSLTSDGSTPLSKDWNINLEGLGAGAASASGGCLLTTCLAGS